MSNNNEGSNHNVSVEPQEFFSGGNENSYNVNEFVDEDLIFDMPNVLVNMAEGMLLSPPRFDFVSDDYDYDHEPAENMSCDDQNLWSYPYFP